MIDLHIHTKCSDGTDNIKEILQKAEKINLEVISITDHDNVDAYLELEKIDVKKYYTGKIIKGSEMKSVYKSVPIEILGYGINLEKIKKFKYIVSELSSNLQEKYLYKIKEIGKSIGLKFDDKLKIDEQNIFASATFFKEIVKYSENEEIIKKYNLGKDVNHFYREAQSNPNSVFYIDESKDISSPYKIIEEIHKAGGLAFLAHPLCYRFENKFEVIEEFINEFNIDGLECYYSIFSEQETNGLLKLCKKYNLLKSGGSDYHGKNKPDINLGIGKGNLNISKELIMNWNINNEAYFN